MLKINELRYAPTLVTTRAFTRLGPPMKWSPDMEVKARSLMTKDGQNADNAARVLGLSRRAMFRGLRWFATMMMNLSAPTGLCS